MSRSKRRSDNLAPALFPFLAVLLCTIGALILVLAVTVTHSHASAKKEKETDYLVAMNKRNMAEANLEQLEIKREELKKHLDAQRMELAEIEDHIDRITKELQSLQAQLSVLQAKQSGADVKKDQDHTRVDELKKEIDSKRLELAMQIEKQKRKKPAFAIVPYSGQSGTNRRPIYIECTKDGIVLQPEGVKILPVHLIPPGPSNPLAAALRQLRKAYEEMDRQQGISIPPYPLLLVRPDGIESYAHARQAMSDWDDQFGYELIEADMSLAFPPSVPGLKEALAKTVENASTRQSQLLASNPKLLRQYQLSKEDRWEPAESSNSSISPEFGSRKSTAGGGNNLDENSTNWTMVKPFAGSRLSGGSELPSGPTANERDGSGELTMSAAGSSTPSSTNQALNIAQTYGDGRDLVSSGGQQFIGNAGSSSLSGDLERTGTQSTLDGNSTQPANSSAPSNTNNVAGQKVSEGNGSGSGSGMGNANSSQQSSASSGNPNGANGLSMSSGPKPSSVSSMSGDPNDPISQQMPSLSLNVNQADKQSKYVKEEGDLRPISVSAGSNWAQAKAAGKASPVNRNIYIVALKSKWMIRSESSQDSFDTIIAHDQNPKEASQEFEQAIRKRVDSWGLSLPGGFWVPKVIIEAASDAQLSVARLERLLEGSGVDLVVVPLILPSKR